MCNIMIEYNKVRKYFINVSIQIYNSFAFIVDKYIRLNYATSSPICRGELLHITVVFAFHQTSIQTTRPCNVRHTFFLLLLINFHLLSNE